MRLSGLVKSLPFGALAGVAAYDLLQKKHAILRNFPVVGRFRYWFEELGEYFRQYFFANDREEMPFNRATRAWVYRLSKNEGGVKINVPLVASALNAVSVSSSRPPANTYTPAAFISSTTALASGPRPRNHSSVSLYGAPRGVSCSFGSFAGIFSPTAGADFFVAG